MKTKEQLQEDLILRKEIYESNLKKCHTPAQRFILKEQEKAIKEIEEVLKNMQ